MKKIIVLATCLLMITLVSNAQTTTDTTKKDKVKSRIGNMDTTRKQNLKDKGLTKENLKDLDLSKDQATQLEKIKNETRQEKEKIKNDNSLTEEQKKEKLKAAEENFKNKSGAVLTKEQRQKIKDKKGNKKGTGGGK
ncbi:hypothetical protein [Limnovirga soli]|uniref:DUF4890 domain-containing protein n=1 Tax=Limnovirga soli TaxID=2656915 RepID=A0A8J8JYS7_9BACT|nr:hypothetical protein [Limnovirga soli]NNV57606.1 hypothetical protein [Limnovirga soli]